jgi:hypothetical protein
MARADLVHSPLLNRDGFVLAVRPFTIRVPRTTLGPRVPACPRPSMKCWRLAQTCDDNPGGLAATVLDEDVALAPVPGEEAMAGREPDVPATAATVTPVPAATATRALATERLRNALRCRDALRARGGGGAGEYSEGP